MAKRILIADDSLTIQKAFAMTFAGEDVTLLAARSADEALTMARQARPELVIADVVMPGRSGYDLCAAIKSDPALRGVPVYMLASSQNPYDEARGRHSGADGQFTKPFESVSIVERAKEAIARGVSAPAVTTPPPVVAFPAPANVAMPAAVSARPGAPPPAGLSQAPLDDDYGEISIDESHVRSPAGQGGAPILAEESTASEITPPPRAPLLVPQRPAAPSPAANPPGGLRPSLIPGLRPGAAPSVRSAPMPARPIAVPGYTVPHAAGNSPLASHPPSAHAAGPTQAPGPTHGPGPVARGPVPSMPAVSSAPPRTLMGLPAAGQVAARFGVPTAPARPPTQPVRPLDTRTPVPVVYAPAIPHLSPTPAAIASRTESKVDQTIDQKIAAIAAKGPEYEAIAKLSREIIEKIVWEIVPELAEVIVREELQKRGRI
jgi:CheY-like chemotaxis protein